MHRPDGRAHRKQADARCARVEVASYPNAKYCRAAMRECMRMLRTIRMRNTFRATMRRCEREERTIGTRNFLRATARVGAASYPNTKVSSSDDAPVHVGAIALTRARTGGDRIAVWPIARHATHAGACCKASEGGSRRAANRAAIYGCCGTAGMVPAIVVITPSGVSFSTRSLPVSAM